MLPQQVHRGFHDTRYGVVNEHSRVFTHCGKESLVILRECRPSRYRNDSSDNRYPAEPP